MTERMDSRLLLVGNDGERGRNDRLGQGGPPNGIRIRPKPNSLPGLMVGYMLGFYEVMLSVTADLWDISV